MIGSRTEMDEWQSVVDDNELNNPREDCDQFPVVENNDDEDWSGRRQFSDTIPKCMYINK